jgi:CBS domain-containing protein
MKLQDIMTIGVTTGAPDMSLQEAAHLMQKANVGMLPVVEKNEIVGVVTDRDLVVRGLSRPELPSQVHDVMTYKAVTLPPSADVQTAIRTMADHKIGRVLVVDENKKLRGVVSANDVARAHSDEHAVSELTRALGSAHGSKEQAAPLAEV